MLDLSCGLIVYAINIDELASIYGSGNEKLISLVQKQCHNRIVKYNREFSLLIEHGAPSLLEALAEIIRGEALNQKYGAIYAYAIELYCEVFQEDFLNNAPFYPCSYKWLQEVDFALEELGIVKEFRLVKLIDGSLPLPIPSVQDLPAFGYITTNIAYQAFEEIKNQDYIGADNTITEAIGTIKQWLNYVGKRFDSSAPVGLVGFYH
ncbi:hypothetical protein [Mastigocoleus sp. MO_188.B34]|uniref:DUF7691 family protein n=1 Tax=Mastigocoleus sp. MO_188.B34 TaxID=3036635 RepID=UPI002621B723|nr:hypothetical protein [Mastigocoleus sp. MO_188.B34]MDJ0694733.1 hypothetical protein [Mastigocoleus sp. MO_188.B34]